MLQLEICCSFEPIAYGKAAESKRSCQKSCLKFKNGKFEIEDKALGVNPTIYKLEALLQEESC